MHKLFVSLGATLGLLSVAVGAFGAHALKNKLSMEMLTIYQTGVQYHQIHALALLSVGLLASHHQSLHLSLAGWLFTGGIVVFSGSLYALALTGIKLFGATTPLGGLALMFGWAALLWDTLKQA